MASNIFNTYDRNLRRVYLAEFIDDHLHARENWRCRVSPNRTLFGETVRSQVRDMFVLSPAGEVSS